MDFIVTIFFLCFQIAALLAAIWHWHSYKNTTQRHFLWFLIYVVCHEISGLCYSYYFNQYNDIVYNIFTLVSFSFYSWWFYKVLEQRKWLVQVTFMAFITIFLYDLFDKNPWDYLYLNPIMAGAFCILVLTISYFVELLNTDAITTFAASQKFWIVTGLFCFYIGLLPLLIFHRYLYYGGNFYGIVITVLNAVLYGCIFKSFLCLEKKK